MKSVYRKVSLDRLSSPEQLDMLVQVTDVRGWLGLSAVGILLAMVIGWGIWGKIPSQISMPAIVLNSDGPEEVKAAVQGEITKLYGQSNQEVAKGQLLAELTDSSTNQSVQVYSDRAGQLLGFSVAEGSLVAAGDAIAHILPIADAATSQQARLYVSYESSSTLAEGMIVTITPRNETAAPIEGRISSIGQLPISPATIARELGSEALLAVLVTSPTPVEVIVTWEGTAVSPGVLADATILVSESRPIDLVIPIR